MKLLRHLEDIDPSEVTLCGLPATRKKFLFFKQDMQRSLDTSKAMQGDSDIEKRNEVIRMDPEIQKLLNEYFGEEVSIEEFEKAELSEEAIKAIKGALNLINKYKADFPDDLKKAVGLLAKYAAGYGYPAKKKEVKKEGDQDLEKSGIVLSKDSIKKIKNVIKALKDLLPEIEANKGLEKSDDSEEDAGKEFKKALAEVTDIAKKLEKKLEEKDQTIEKLGKRLETVEKEKGIKKGIDSQDSDDGDDSNKSKKKWASFGV